LILKTQPYSIPLLDC